MRLLLSISLVCLLLTSLPVMAQDSQIEYVPRHQDTDNKELGEIYKAERKAEDSVTAAIRDRQDAYREMQDDRASKLRFDVTGIERPESPEDFTSAYFAPPVGQYRTGTCWCFSGTSFIESEVYRLTGQKIKLSEMFTVYHEYIEKVRRFVRERGDSRVSQGSESNAVFRIMELHGAVPADAYAGIVGDEPRHDHSHISKEIRALLTHVKEGGFWNEEVVVTQVRAILDSYLGPPPTTVVWEGRTLTPRQFATEILQYDSENYVDCISTLKQPFYRYGTLDVGDNWWFDSTYYNLPLEEWYGVIVKAVTNGYTMAIGGDVSEPGYYGVKDIAVIPEFDIPHAYINQDSREYRLYNHSTTDDHGVHLVGYTKIGDDDWFLIKDSSSGGRAGTFWGFLFFRADYVRLKMMSFMVHRDMVKELLEKEQIIIGG